MEKEWEDNGMEREGRERKGRRELEITMGFSLPKVKAPVTCYVAVYHCNYGRFWQKIAMRTIKLFHSNPRWWKILVCLCPFPKP